MPDLQGALEGADTLRGLHERFLRPGHTGAGSEKMVLDGGSLNVSDACDVVEASIAIGRALAIDQREMSVHGHTVLNITERRVW